MIALTTSCRAKRPPSYFGLFQLVVDELSITSFPIHQLFMTSSLHYLAFVQEQDIITELHVLANTF